MLSKIGTLFILLVGATICVAGFVINDPDAYFLAFAGMIILIVGFWCGGEELAGGAWAPQTREKLKTATWVLLITTPICFTFFAPGGEAFATEVKKALRSEADDHFNFNPDSSETTAY